MQEEYNTKRCPQCDIYYPRTAEYFYRDKDISDGLACWCKKCKRKRCDAYQATHREQAREKTRQWRDLNPDRHLEWARENKDKICASAHRYRARKLGLPSTLTPAEWENILADYGYQCAYCDKTWLDCRLTQDHVIPITQDGGYTKENIVPACGSCNSRKKDRTPEQAGMQLRKIDQNASSLSLLSGDG